MGIKKERKKIHQALYEMTKGDTDNDKGESLDKNGKKVDNSKTYKGDSKDDDDDDDKKDNKNKGSKSNGNEKPVMSSKERFEAKQKEQALKEVKEEKERD